MVNGYNSLRGSASILAISNITIQPCPLRMIGFTRKGVNHLPFAAVQQNQWRLKMATVATEKTGEGENDDPSIPVNGHKPPSFWILALGSIGVVYGDIGTSPLYAIREAVLAGTEKTGPIT